MSEKLINSAETLIYDKDSTMIYYKRWHLAFQSNSVTTGIYWKIHIVDSKFMNLNLDFPRLLSEEIILATELQ